MWKADTRALAPTKFNGKEHHHTLYCAGAGQQLKEHPSNRADWLVWVAHKWLRKNGFYDRAACPAAVVARY
jgi:hypothetical protein